jgi:SPP1 family predicted phage head-tail adaptor
MRSGNLDRTIVLEVRGADTIDAAGTPSASWSPFATVRAQLIELSTQEYLREYGEGENAVAVFRIRWLDDVTPALRLVYGERTYNVRDVKEIGRRRGLDLRCEEVRQ